MFEWEPYEYGQTRVGTFWSPCCVPALFFAAQLQHSNFQNWICCIELGSCLNTFLSAHSVSPTTAMRMNRPSSFTMTAFPERRGLLVSKGKVSFSWSAWVWHGPEGLLRLCDESLLVYGSNENFSSSFLVLHQDSSALPSHACTSSVLLPLDPLFFSGKSNKCLLYHPKSCSSPLVALARTVPLASKLKKDLQLQINLISAANCGNLHAHAC